MQPPEVVSDRLYCRCIVACPPSLEPIGRQKLTMVRLFFARSIQKLQYSAQSHVPVCNNSVAPHPPSHMLVHSLLMNCLPCSYSAHLITTHTACTGVITHSVHWGYHTQRALGLSHTACTGVITHSVHWGYHTQRALGLLHTACTGVITHAM